MTLASTRLPVVDASGEVVDLPEPGANPDLSQRVLQTYMLGVYLAVNAIEDLYALIEGPDCVHMKTQYVQGNHDWLSTLTSVSGVHRIANTALHPVQMTGSREQDIRAFLERMGRHPAVNGVLLTSMPMAFITGADYERLCRDAGEATGKPYVHVKGNSLSGDWLDGYAECLYSFSRQLDLTGGTPDPNKVAIIGNMFDRNEGDHRGNVRELRRILEGLGLEVVSIWLDGGRFEDLLEVRNAGVVISLPYGRKAAKQVARKVGAKLIECELPFGLPATERFVRKVAQALGREEQGEALLDRELSAVVPALEFVIPFSFQNRTWAFVGDPHLASGIREIAELLGSRLIFAVITNLERHAAVLGPAFREGVKMLVHPRQKAFSRFLNEAGKPSVVVTTTDGISIGDTAVVEFGYPSMYTHCLYERPFLGFRGFLAFVDSVANAIRAHEVRVARGSHERKEPIRQLPGGGR